MENRYDVAAYIWPSYTGDEPRAWPFWPERYGEWQTVKAAKPKFEGHQWPRRPLWGYVNEADPYVMEMQIEAAVDHGVNVFIYDWYWYDKRPFLEQCLNNGFLGAKNNHKMKFYLMYANHDVVNLWDKRLSSTDMDTVIWDAKIDRAEFEKIWLRNIEKYMKLPNYYCIDGKPVLMIFDTKNLIKGLGGVGSTRAAFDWLREAAVKAGLPGIHLQMGMYRQDQKELPGMIGGLALDPYEVLRDAGFDSSTHYQFVQFTDIDRPYPEIIADVQKEFETFRTKSHVPYYPHISVGWDNNPRFDAFRPGIVRDNTPGNIELGLRMVREYADKHLPGQKLITLNSWNEWMETSYLQPDDLYGYGYLEAVKRVFGGRG